MQDRRTMDINNEEGGSSGGGGAMQPAIKMRDGWMQKRSYTLQNVYIFRPLRIHAGWFRLRNDFALALFPFSN
jgi:hypothetical protein